ncbi:MAG: response regulator [bacterium]|nr:response regulator [bacterium]
MSKRILVIDDNQEFCNMLENMLSRVGYRVEIMPSPILGAGDALSGQYDLITLDLRMPEANGEELAELFQTQTLTTPVLVISGYLNNTIQQQLRQAGITHMLSKPFKQAELVQAIEHAIADSGAED